MFDAVKLDGNLYTTGYYISNWIHKNIENNVPDGSDYSIQFAVKADNSNDWQLVLCPNNLPNYAAATVKNNTIVSVKQNEPVPNVTLVKPIMAENELHAKGSGKFTLVLKNNSNDFILNHIWLKFTDVNNESKVYYVHEDDKKNNSIRFTIIAKKLYNCYANYQKICLLVNTKYRLLKRM